MLWQCPMYEYFKPDAYNYSLTKEQRQRLVEKVRRRLSVGACSTHMKAVGAALDAALQRALVWLRLVRNT